VVAPRTAKNTVKIVVGALILLSIPAILFLGWVAFPLSQNVSGISLRILLHSNSSAAPTWISYAAADGLMLVVATSAWFRDKPTQLYCAGATLLLLATAAVLQVAFADPELLKRLLDEADWSNAAAAFAGRYLPPNLGTEPTQWRYFSFGSVGDRLVSGWYFMGLGWYIGIGVGFAISHAGARGANRRFRLRAIGITAVALLAVTAAFAQSPIRGASAVVAAKRAEANGRPADALRAYRKAIKLDRWNALNLNIYERIGAIYANSGHTWTPEYRLSYAEYLVEQDRYSEAIAQYEDLVAAGGPLSSVAVWRSSELLIVYGLNLYELGSFGAAVDAWQQALAHEPSMWLAAFYLSRGYFAVGNYLQAIMLIRRCSQQVADPIFLANLYSNLGDAYMRDGEFGPAHLAYNRSYSLDYLSNFRGLSSLVGP
jgi:tetratricopeptide (TPR) repeat protein